MPEVISYLKNLKFDPKLATSLIAKYLRNQRLVVLVVLLIAIMGIASYSNLPRVLNPQIKIPIVIVSTVLPGAGPNDIESLITVPIEDSLNNLSRVKTMSSTSRDSVSIITLEFESGVDPDKAKSDVQNAVDSVSGLPQDAQTPQVQKLDFENEPVWTFAVSSSQDQASLTRFSRNLSQALKNLASIDRVETSGLDEQEVQVLIKPDAIATYGVNPFTLSQSVKTALGSAPAGTIITKNSSFTLTIDPTITTLDGLRRLRLNLNGNSVLLGDIASIALRPKPDTASAYIASHDQSPTHVVSFSVYKTSTSNITKAVEDARKLTDEMAKPYNGKIKISSVINSGEEIDKQYYELLRDMGITVGLVFLTLFVFLGARQAVVSSFAIPLTFLITFIVMNLTGIALSFIAFFSLLLSLGLLVDDTIVVISAITAYYRSGKFSPFETGLLVWRDFVTAIFTTTLTTVWAFVPLLLSSGIIGEFIKPIPIVVSSTLLASFIVAMFITMPFILMLLKPNLPFRVVVLLRVLGLLAIFAIFIAIAPKGSLLLPGIILFFINLFIYFQVKNILFTRLKNRIFQSNHKGNLAANKVNNSRTLNQYLDHGIISFEQIGHKYRRILDAILSKKNNRRKAIAMVVIFSLFSYFLLPLGFVKNEFFPAGDQPYLYISLEMPAGTNLAQTREQGLKILNDVRKNPEISFATLTPRQNIDPGRGYGSAGDNTALITMILPPEEKRSKTSIDIAQELRDKYANFQKGTISVVEVSGGPPAGSDLQIQLYGDDLAVLDTYADKIQNYLKKQPGVTNINKSIKPGTSKIVFNPDYQKMIDSGVSTDQVGLWLRTFASGFTLDNNVKLEPGNPNDQDIVFRTSTAQQTTQDITSMSVPTTNGVLPITSLGDLTLKPNPTLITRENGKRTISVGASVTKGYSITDKNKQLEQFADTIGLPEGYSWKTGGVNEENQNSVNSILQAMLLSFLLIIITMVLQFSSFRKALIVMLVIPLSISGVFIVFALSHTPLSFPALIGVLALFGIVVKNSILLVDKINQNLSAGLPFKEAIVDASESRLEPIALTSFTAIIGLIPITLSDPLWRGLGGAIISGLFFSGTIMLFFIPVVYYLIYQNSEGKNNLALPGKKKTRGKTK